MKKRSLLLAVMMLSIFVLTACGGASNDKAANDNKAANNAAADAGDKKDGEKLKVGFVTDEGGINDQSFNQGVWEGLQKVHDDFGFEVSYQESKEANDYAPISKPCLKQETTSSSPPAST